MVADGKQVRESIPKIYKDKFLWSNYKIDQDLNNHIEKNNTRPG